MKENRFKVLIGKDLPITWRKRISLSKNENIKNHKWYHPKCIIWWPFFQKWLFTEYHDHFLMLDYLIIGDNPILNTILIKKMFDKAILTQRPIKIGIVKQKSFDYWGYHYYKKEEKEFQKILADIENLSHYHYRHLLTFIEIENNFDIAYYRQFTDNNNYCFFLSQPKEYKHFIESEMPNLAQAQRKLKNSLSDKINAIQKKNFTTYDFVFPQTPQNHFNYIISPHVFFTNYQKDLNYQTEKKSYNVNNELMTTTIFHHELEKNSLGSAFHHPDSFSFLEEFISIDIEKCKSIKV